MEKSNIVHTLGKVRKQIADPFGALTVLLELPARLDDAAFVLDAASARGFDFDGLVVHTDHRRFVVERVDMAGAAVHEQEDDAFCLRLEVRLFGSKWIDEFRLTVGGDRLRGKETIVEQSRQSQTGKAGAGFPKELATRASTEISLATRHRMSDP